MSQPVPWSSHRLLLRLAVIEGWLVNETPLRVGTGREPPLGSAVDLAVIRIHLGGRSVPYIPGSSLKGVFRSTAIQLARAKGLNVCSGLSGDTCMDWESPKYGTSLLRFIQERQREGDEPGAFRVFHEDACLLCKMFGAPSFTGHVEFSDAYPLDEKGQLLEVPLGVRTGIAIDRRTGAVYRGALYQVEFVEPGARFKLAVRATNLPNYALGLLAKILKMLHEGWVRVGGFKTRGFGEVRVENLSFSVTGGTVSGTKLLAVDERDVEVDLAGLAQRYDGWLKASGDNAWRALSKLEEVWDRAALA
ncbi:MAG: CRISPR-associated RAMP protein Csx7 [Thermofilaceae archaeon]